MYKPTIGLEIHAELSTKTKMFCDCRNDRDEKEPNKNVCEICLAHPGTMPTINKSAVEAVWKLGLAIGGEIPDISKFDRKSYFYPDLPKGYQISQYDMPLVMGGELNGVRITRVHLEEDTGRLQHLTIDNKQLTEGRGSDVRGQVSGVSLVDFNRAGRPLMELVTEPDITSADQALDFARELQTILRYIGISTADMEHGEMRVEANISVSQDGPASGASELGTKVEIKNLNSFKAVRDAIAYEIESQIKALEAGEKIVQETRGWDDAKKQTFSQRSKEEAHDYRYLPEPDLPPVKVNQKTLDRLSIELPELPKAKAKRFTEQFGLSEEQARLIVEDRWLAEYYENVLSEMGQEKDPVLAFNYITTDLLGLIKAAGADIRDVREKNITEENFAELMLMIKSGKLGSRGAKDVLKKMFETGGDPSDIVEVMDIAQVSDEGELGKIVQEVITESERAVADYKKGKVAALEALVGKAMGKLKGKGNPEVLRKLFLDHLSK